VPALATDLLLQRSKAWRPVIAGLAAGVVFLTTFIAVQWPFANFLMTPLARNRFFGTEYMDFSTPPQSAYARFEFVDATSQQLWRGLLVAALLSALMAWLGVRAGRAMQKVRR
jgi:hypothetical protein